MFKIDARKRSIEVQQHNREQAIRLYLDGISRAEIAKVIDVHYGTLAGWIRRYNQGGIEALQIGSRGRSKGEGRKLTANQEQKLKEILVGKSPEQMQLPFALWSSGAIRLLIREQWHINLPQRTISAYMKRWGYTPQKAAKQAYERSDKATQEWLGEACPAIKKRAALQGGEVFWGVRLELAINANMYEVMRLEAKLQ
ncbi:MAG: transposase [Arenicella sp.]|jgi:transposase